MHDTSICFLMSFITIVLNYTEVFLLIYIKFKLKASMYWNNNKLNLKHLFIVTTKMYSSALSCQFNTIAFINMTTIALMHIIIKFNLSLCMWLSWYMDSTINIFRVMLWLSLFSNRTICLFIFWYNIFFWKSCILCELLYVN